MHNRQTRFVIVNGVLQGLAHQTLGAFARDRLDADAGRTREADLGDAHFLLQEIDQLLGFVRLGFKLDSGINVFGVFAEDHHIGLLRLFDGTGNAVKVLDRTQANVQIEFLTQRYVEGPNASPHRRGQRAFDGYHVLTQRLQGFCGQPDIRTVNLGRLLASVDLHPVNLFLARVSLGDSGINHLEHHRRDVKAGPITLNKRNHRLVWHIERHVGIHRDLLALGWNLDVLVHEISPWRVEFGPGLELKSAK